jgi:hypothetical protein
MDIKKVIIASLIYAFWSFLIGYFVPEIAGWATIMAALAAGIYVGYKSDVGKSFDNGLLAGLLGGIFGAVIMNYTPSLLGIPLKVATSEFLSPIAELIETSFPWVSELFLIVIGTIFGGIGGIIGSRKKLGKVFLFLTLFLLFIFYGAIDNVAWNWGRADWTWNMSISHVLTNRIDLFIAVVFAAFTTILAFVLLG